MLKMNLKTIKLILLTAFTLLFAVTLLLPELAAATKPSKTMPAFIVLDNPEKKMSEHAGDKGKTPFDHDQHVAKDSCVTCHHTNSEKLTKAVEEDVLRCTVCHKAEDTEKSELEGTREGKTFKGKFAMNAKDAYHGDSSIVGCIGCHREKEIEPIGCNTCHTGEDTIQYQYKK
jgi:hypothetical protein